MPRTPDAEPVLTLDVLGRPCPAPVIELARHIGSIGPGNTICVLADDPAAALDIPAWCELRGQEFLSAQTLPAGPAYLVRRVR